MLETLERENKENLNRGRRDLSFLNIETGPKAIKVITTVGLAMSKTLLFGWFSRKEN